MTAPSTVSPRYASASALSFWRIIAEISGGECCLLPASTRASPPLPATTLYGTIASSSRTSASLRPMKRLIEKTVLVGLVTAWRLATVPTRRSPDWAKATTDGVVRPPSAFSMTVGSPPSRTAMHEFVVPRSMPMVLAMCRVLLLPVLSAQNLSPGIADPSGVPQRLGMERAQAAGLVVAQRVGPVEGARVHPGARRELERALERMGQEVPAEPLSLRVGEQAEVGDLHVAVPGPELVVAGVLAVDRGDPRLDLVGPRLPLGVAAPEVVGPPMGRADVLVEPAADGAVGRLDLADLDAPLDARLARGPELRRAGHLEVGADDGRVAHGPARLHATGGTTPAPPGTSAAARTRHMPAAARGTSAARGGACSRGTRARRRAA